MQTVQMEFTASNLITIVNQSSNGVLCTIWNITTQYSIESFSQIILTVAAQNSDCAVTQIEESPLYEYAPKFYAINIAIIIFAMISLILTASYIHNTGGIYMEAKILYKNVKELDENRGNRSLTMLKKKEFMEKREKLLEDAGENAGEINQILATQLAWEDLPIAKKLKFFNMWFIIKTLGNLFQIFGAGRIIIVCYNGDLTESIYYGTGVVGLGCAFAWLQLLHFLEYYQNITLISSTLVKAAGNIFKVFSMITPLFIGFVFLGLGYYWRYTSFHSAGGAATILFSLSCGDSVHETFLNTWDEGDFKQFYLILYMICFYTAAQNIFVAIIMEAYEVTKIRKKLDNDDPFPDTKNIDPQGIQSSFASPSDITNQS